MWYGGRSLSNTDMSFYGTVIYCPSHKGLEIIYNPENGCDQNHVVAGFI